MERPHPEHLEWGHLTFTLGVRPSRPERLTLVEEVLRTAPKETRSVVRRAVVELETTDQVTGRTLLEVEDSGDALAQGLVQLLTQTPTSGALETIGEHASWEQLAELVMDLSETPLGKEARQTAKELLVQEGRGHRAGEAALAVQHVHETGTPPTPRYVQYVKEQDLGTTSHFEEVHRLAVRAGLTDAVEETYHRLLLDGTAPQRALQAAQALT